MTNESTTPLTIEAINDLLSRVGTIEKQPTAWSRGDIKMFYGATADLPSNWWPCDGTAAPDGVTTPDLRGRAPFGLKSSDASFDTLGETGGSATHAHSGAPHDHTIEHLHDVEGTTNGVLQAGSGGANTLDTTVNLAHGGSDKVAREAHVHSMTVAGTVSQDEGISGAAAYTGNTGNAATIPPYAVVNFAYRYV